MGVCATVLFPVVGALMAGLADAISAWVRTDITSDLAGRVDDVGVKKFDDP